MIISKLKPGMTVYSVKRATGNAIFYCKWQTWSVYIKEVDIGGNRVLASWNGNKPEWYTEYTWKKWRMKRPENRR